LSSGIGLGIFTIVTLGIAIIIIMYERDNKYLQKKMTKHDERDKTSSK